MFPLVQKIMKNPTRNTGVIVEDMKNPTRNTGVIVEDKVTCF